MQEKARPLPAAGIPAPRRSDIRAVGLGIALVGIALFGFLVGVFSSPSGSWAGAFSGDWVASLRAERHVDAERQREVDTRFKQGVAMLQGKQYEYALTAFHRVLQLNPNIAEAYVNSGFAMLGLKHFKEAADFFNDATELNKNQLNAYYGMGIALKEMGDLEAAVGAMRTYTHLAKPEDPFQRRAWSALWEWETDLKIRRGEQPPIPSYAVAPRDPPSAQH